MSVLSIDVTFAGPVWLSALFYLGLQADLTDGQPDACKISREMVIAREINRKGEWEGKNDASLQILYTSNRWKLSDMSTMLGVCEFYVNY